MTSLDLLQEKLSSPLYLVGGAVRNELLGLPVSDYDICGDLSPERLSEELVGLFTLRDVNPRIGTVKIVGEGVCFEYTRFRRDSYPIDSGEHIPSGVEFVSSPEEDAFRRDFTVNAIYKRSDGMIIDPTGGLADLEKRVLRTTREPEAVFSEDGLRLLRLVRLAAELGFDIEQFSKNSYTISGIPAMLDTQAAITALNNIIHTVRETGLSAKERWKNQIALSLAKDAAVQSGKKISDDEAQELVRALFDLPQYMFTPDGKKVISILSDDELQSRFGIGR